MPRGPNGEHRPADAGQCALKVAKIATGEITEDLPSKNKQKGGQAGGRARAKSLSPNRRSSIAREAAQARWGGRLEAGQTAKPPTTPRQPT